MKTKTSALSPIHPGEILREEFMIPLDLSSNALATAIGVTAARVNEIAKESAASLLTPRSGSRATSAQPLTYGSTYNSGSNWKAHALPSLASLNGFSRGRRESFELGI